MKPIDATNLVKEIDLLWASKFKQLCQQAALLTKFDREFTDVERKMIGAAKHYLEIALENDKGRRDAA